MKHENHKRFLIYLELRFESTDVPKESILSDLSYVEFVILSQSLVVTCQFRAHTLKM
jgi:hypothetical protein